MIKYLEEYGAMLRITESYRFKAALKAACDACDFLMANRLLDLEGPYYSSTLRCGLPTAISSDRVDVAAKLFAAGLFLNTKRFFAEEQHRLISGYRKKAHGTRSSVS